ncbi:hypothetical protein GCM10011343_15880 [Flavobacterium orientale]|uniref:Uncharacterized protein n=1 Tax=Flavobacterium orientale TaxID=1756020 RepID=A0A917DD14_9FLAO|nr:hypothetical protein GCM10011343_15880 [Flavobacterium orientale]
MAHKLPSASYDYCHAALIHYLVMTLYLDLSKKHKIEAIVFSPITPLIIVRYNPQNRNIEKINSDSTKFIIMAQW